LPNNLVIVESPTKSKTLKKFLGRGFTVKATGGHLFDLPKSKLGIDLENNFEPEYRVIKGKAATIKELLKAAKKADRVYLAPDPDREGEAIAYHVADKLRDCGAEIYRAAFNEITKKAVVAAMEQAGEVDQKKVDAQQARRLLDRLVGYKVSPVLWKTVCRGLSAGRVQSVALRIICEREAEIDAFTAVEYWKFLGTFLTEQDEKFSARLAKIDGKDVEIDNEAAAAALNTDLLKQNYQVDDVRIEKRTRRPLPPYITSTMQQDASVRISFAPARTMSIAQQLYEGIELGSEGSVGLISYMRTDSVRIADEARGQAKDYIIENFGPDFYPEKPNFYKTKKSAQDAHEAIRPTSLQYTPEMVKRYLSREQFRLYQLIFNRFLASQMAPAQIDQLTIKIAGGKYLFRVTSSKTTFQGFLAAYSMTPKENNNGDGDEAETELPDLKKDEKLTCDSIEPTQHFTKPPPRFTEASLIKELESDGIGRPSTYAQILSRLKTRKYVELESRRLQPTDLGKTVNELLIMLFPDIFSIEFTANMENDLDKIETGECSWRQVLADFYNPFAVRLDEVEAKRDEIKKTTQKVSEHKCDKCGEPMIEKWGRNGRFLACSGYPECKNTMPLNGEPLKQLDEKCEECGAPMVIREGRFGQFKACSAYPECKNTKPIPTGIKCPNEGCDGDVIERRTKRGKTFWGCSRYPDCEFASWAKPVNTPCKNCGHAWVQEKETKTHGPHHYCPECKHRAPLAEEAKAESAKV
jgi:DNA topoisomerase-1